MDPDHASSPASLLERMKQRTDDLALRAEHRRTEKENQVALSESSDYFHKSFQQMKRDAEEKLGEAGDVGGKARLMAHFNELEGDVQLMQQFLNESSMFLASFQIKKAQEEMKELNDLIQDKKQELQPKKRFGFGTKMRERSERAKDAKEEDNTDSETKSQSLDNLMEKLFFGFKDLTGQTLAKLPGELERRQLNLQNLRECKVLALGNPSTLQVDSLRDCTVIVGPTSRSVFIKDCTGCTFVIACQQIRIHDTRDTQFYLHVTGAAIIENCQNVQFAPYSLHYPELEDHYSQSGLDLDTNHWDIIDDFRWLNENQKSPNWSVIPENERLDKWLD